MHMSFNEFVNNLKKMNTETAFDGNPLVYVLYTAGAALNVERVGFSEDDSIIKPILQIVDISCVKLNIDMQEYYDLIQSQEFYSISEM